MVALSPCAAGGDAATDDGVFCGARELHGASPAAGLRLDRTAGANAGLVPGLIDVFWKMMLVSAAAVPLALIMRKVKLRAGAPIAH
jgi:hypothetical protein